MRQDHSEISEEAEQTVSRPPRWQSPQVKKRTPQGRNQGGSSYTQYEVWSRSRSPLLLLGPILLLPRLPTDILGAQGHDVLPLPLVLWTVDACLRWPSPDTEHLSRT
jgi:hypothetical protein